MMGKYEIISVCVLAWFLHVRLTASYQDLVECVDASDTNCVEVQLQGLTHTQATSNGCYASGTYLVLDYNNDTNTQLAAIAAANNLPNVWIGGLGTAGDWTWTEGGFPVGYQGCFSALSVGDPFLSDTQPVQVNNLAHCTRRCVNRGNYYAGLRKNSANVLQCYCADSYPLSLATQGCSGCPTEPTAAFCGSDVATAVYVANASMQFSSWESDTPERNNEFCAFINSGSNYKWRDSRCNSLKNYLCQYDYMNEQQCLQFRGLPTVLYFWLDSQKCVSAHNTARSWYDALQNCGERGGQLLNIWNQNEQTELANVLRSNFQQNRLWIGLTRWHWQWLGWGEIFSQAPYFNNWANGQPEDTEHARCMKLFRQGERYRWYNSDCNQPKPSLCYRDPSPATTEGTPAEPDIETTADTAVQAQDSDRSGNIIPLIVGLLVGPIILFILVGLTWKFCRHRNLGESKPPVLRQISYLSRNSGVYDYIDEKAMSEDYQSLQRNGRPDSHVYQKSKSPTEGGFVKSEVQGTDAGYVDMEGGRRAGSVPLPHLGKLSGASHPPPSQGVYENNLPATPTPKKRQLTQNRNDDEYVLPDHPPPPPPTKGPSLAVENPAYESELAPAKNKKDLPSYLEVL